MIDLHDIEVPKYEPIKWPEEGLIPHRIAYYEGLSVLAAIRAGYKVIQPNN